MPAANIYRFPGIDDRQVIQNAVELFLQTGNCSVRNTMINTIDKVLDKYGVSHIHLPNFVVSRDADKTLHVTADWKVAEDYRTCPRCETDIYDGKVLLLSQIVVRKKVFATYGCRSCGLVFGKYEGKEADLL